MSAIKQPQINDYVRLMREPPSYEQLGQLCVSGELRTSSARGLVWRMLLKCLPLSHAEWPTVLSRGRASYDRLKELHVMDPHLQQDYSLDPSIHNPLSEEEQNPWKKFFEDGDLRELIAKDVDRTFPEMEFFQQERIREMLSDILLIYAKENPYVSYKQGMHEILAPLLFVLYSDQQTYEHYAETGALSKLPSSEQCVLQCVHDSAFLEHDSFALFSEVMRDVSKWYEDGGSPTVEEKAFIDPVTQRPFMRVQDAPATSRLMDELARIGEKLEEVDPTLHKHLSSLDIPPQLYGIRWLRLLFGREFPLHDLLYLWDALFSQPPLSKLVHCMFVAMLMHIRALLLSSDYSGCLQYLMRYPPVVDVAAFLRLVLHLRFPTKYAKPRDSSALANYTHITVTGTTHPNRGRDAPIVLTRDPTTGEAGRLPNGELSPGKQLPPQMPARSNSIFGRARRKEPSTAVDAASLVPCPAPSHFHSLAACSTNGHSDRSTPVNGALTEEERELERVQDALREAEQRAADCARKLRRLAAELQGPSGAEEAKRAEVAEKIVQLAADLSVSLSSPRRAPVKSSLPEEELADLRSSK